MKKDGTMSVHGDEWKRVLGYRYNPISEEMHISPINWDPSASTKREVLFGAAKIFDPLSLCFSVTVRSWVLLGTMWKNGSGWDDPLPPEVLGGWREVARDLSGLSNSLFNRQALVGWQPGDMYLFLTLLRRHMGLPPTFYGVNDLPWCLQRQGLHRWRIKLCLCWSWWQFVLPSSAYQPS